MKLLIYFFVGLLLDLLGTLDVRFVINRRPFSSFLISMAITFVSVLVISEIVLSDERIELVIAYALGSGTGSYLGIVWRLKKM